MSPTRALWRVMTREWRLARHQRSEVWMGLALFVVLMGAARMLLGGDVVVQTRALPVVVWMAAVAASVVGAHNAFEEDAVDGSLEQMLLSRVSPLAIVLGKMVMHWLLLCVPMMVLSAALLSTLFHVDGAMLSVTLLSMLIGSPALSTQGVFTAAMRLRIANATSVLCLVIVPIYGVLILLAGDVMASHLAGQSIVSDVGALLALLVAACFVEPFITASAIREAVS